MPSKQNLPAGKGPKLPKRKLFQQLPPKASQGAKEVKGKVTKPMRRERNYVAKG